ncbi:MAG: efflux RND transporter periplasmic adaptor subunit [Coriobacteriia bacterium]
MARRNKWRRYQGWIAVGALAAIALVAFLALRGSKTAVPATTYTTEAAAKGTLSVTVAGTGNLAVRHEIEAWPSAGGKVRSIKVAEGSEVETGDVLYTLDPATARAATARALASLRQSREGVDRAELSLLQAQNALEAAQDRPTSPTQAPDPTSIDTAEQQVDVAEAGLSSAKASRTSARLVYDQALADEAALSVEAPCSGTVWSVSISKGDTVGSGGGGSSTAAAGGTSGGSSAPVTIARDGEIALQLAVNEVDVPSLKVGQSAEIMVDALPDLSLSGAVDAVSKKGTVSQGVVTYEVWISLDVSDPSLRTGMSGSATIVTAVVRDALLIPNAAIKSDTTNGGYYVQVLDKGATEPRTVTVETGLKGTSQTVVTSGLKAGDLVVTKTTQAGAASDTSGGTSGSGRVGGGVMGFGAGGGPRD